MTTEPANKDGLPLLDRLEQVADHAASTAAEVEALRSSESKLQDRLERLETQLGEMRTAQERTSERLERVLAQQEASTRLDTLEERLGAAHSVGLRTAERVESLADELRRVARMEDGIERLRTEMSERLATLDQEQEQALATRAASLRSDLERVQRGQGELGKRLDDLGGVADRLRDVEQRDEQRSKALVELGAELEALTASRQRVAETAMAAAQDAASRIQSLDEAVEGLRREVESWRTRIEGQEETLRATKAVAERMQTESAQLREEQAHTTEAQRVAEARVEHALSTIRQEQADEWSTFLGQREREREMVDKDRLARDGRQREALEEALDQLAGRLDTRIQELHGRLERDAEDLDGLRRALYEVITRWRDGHEEAVKAIEGQMPGTAQPALLEERRRALRRSLRARRDSS